MIHLLLRRQVLSDSFLMIHRIQTFAVGGFLTERFYIFLTLGSKLPTNNLN